VTRASLEVARQDKAHQGMLKARCLHSYLHDGTLVVCIGLISSNANDRHKQLFSRHYEDICRASRGLNQQMSNRSFLHPAVQWIFDFVYGRLAGRGPGNSFD
jgi:hypothetical protein